MAEIVSLFACLHPLLSATTIAQFSRIGFALLAMTGRVTMLNISRWTEKGGSYRTVQRFFNTILPWGSMCWLFFKTHLLQHNSDYLIAVDETIVSKAGKSTYGLDRFFSSIVGKTIPGVAFFGISLVSVTQRKSYPMSMEQIVRDTSSEVIPPSVSTATLKTRKPGRPKGSRNRNKTVVQLTDELKQIQSMIRQLQKRVDGVIPLRYLVADGHFGHNNAVQMTQQCGLHLISKLRTDAVLYFPSTVPYAGRGRPRIYGERFNPNQIAPEWLIASETVKEVKRDIYQLKLLHKQFAAPLNVVCLLKTNLSTEKQAYVLLFSSELSLEAEKMIDYYRLRFQIEFNFRDAKQFWGLEDFMNVKPTPVSNAANLSMFMVNLSAKLCEPFRLDHGEFSVCSLKAHYRGRKYLHQILKLLPEKPEPIVYDKMASHLGSIGSIHCPRAKSAPR